MTAMVDDDDDEDEETADDDGDCLWRGVLLVMGS
jgi:hypothetical protein